MAEAPCAGRACCRLTTTQFWGRGAPQGERKWEWGSRRGVDSAALHTEEIACAKAPRREGSARAHSMFAGSGSEDELQSQAEPEPEALGPHRGV